MKIAIVGYGKMGKLIERTALDAGHQVVATVDPYDGAATCKVASGDAAALKAAVTASGAEGVIEFTSPAAVWGNVKALLPTRLPLVVGTTGWGDHKGEAERLAHECGGTLMASANFSVGVALFYKVVEEASRLVGSFDEYDVAVWEAHHNQKADSPSGTALEVARRVMAGFSRKDTLVTGAFTRRPAPNELHVSSMRCGAIPGTHKVFFDSAADTIEITHTARSRQGFASGAVRALENLLALLESGSLERGRLYGMADVFPALA